MSQKRKTVEDNKAKSIAENNAGDTSVTKDQVAKRINGLVYPAPIKNNEKCRRLFNRQRSLCHNACNLDYETYGRGKMTRKEYEDRNHYRTSYKTKQEFFPDVVEQFENGKMSELFIYKNRDIIGITDWNDEEIAINNIKPSEIEDSEICYSIVWTNKPGKKILTL